VKKLYFDPANSAKANYGNDTEKIVERLVNRFVGANPEIDYLPVVDLPAENFSDVEGWYHAPLKEFQQIPVGGKVFSETNWPSENKRGATLVLECFGPTQVYVNEALVFASNPSQENCRRANAIEVNLQAGWNKVAVVTEKTPLGLGFKIRSGAPQWDPTQFYRTANYFLPVLGFNSHLIQKDEVLFEEGTIQAFLPKFATITDKDNQIYLIKLAVPNNKASFSYSGQGHLTFVDGTKLLKGAVTKVSRKDHWVDLMYQGASLSADIESITWSGTSDNNWLYCGPIKSSAVASTEFTQLQTGVTGEQIFWKSPIEKSDIRMARNTPLFAHWTYWMGVTLYGFLEAGKYFSKESWIDYALSSVKQITDSDEYGKWDREQYHYALINTQFYWLRELDDCGSFGNLMLESLHYQQNEQALVMADRIAAFMKNDVIRQSDGVYYRADDTMWIDDLYMSTPFLVRYWELTQDEQYLDEAIQQFYKFKKRMFMEDKQLMSHIYDTKFEKANRIPWSRGNGWVIFSLSELLNKLPKEHKERPTLLAFYNQLITGILNFQGENGIWHQVIDYPETYSESSGTSMFICAMARGIRNDYLADELKEKCIQSIQKAWDGLITYCVDKDGNLYGVCRGSGHSFSREYYKGLGWLLNDAHGTGIVALAGVEYEKIMTQYV
jgi:rhamnogalacturonyl hydrolase YesR